MADVAKLQAELEDLNITRLECKEKEGCDG